MFSIYYVYDIDINLAFLLEEDGGGGENENWISISP